MNSVKPRTAPCWYGDLLRAQAAMPDIPLDQIAKQLGLQPRPAADNPLPVAPNPLTPAVQTTEDLTPTNTTDQRKLYLLQVTEYQEKDPVPGLHQDQTRSTAEPIDQLLRRGEEGEPVAQKPLVRAAKLNPWLRRQLRQTRPGRRLDIPKVVRQLAQGKPLRRIPYSPKNHWPHRVQLWRSTRLSLTPLQTDYQQIERELIRQLGANRVQLIDNTDGPDRQRNRTTNTEPHAPQPGDAVLILDDLSQTPAAWARKQRNLQRRQIPIQAIIPAGSTNPTSIRDTSHDIGALPATAYQGDLAAAVQRLLVYTSPALFVEPGLLRAIRTLYPDIPVAAEIALWEHPDICATYRGYCPSPGLLQQDNRQSYAELPDEQKRQIGACILAHHRYWPAEPRAEENHQMHQLGTPLPTETTKEYRHYFSQLTAHIEQGSAPADTENWLVQTGTRKNRALWVKVDITYAKTYLTARKTELQAHPERYPAGLNTEYWKWVYGQPYPTQPNWLVETNAGIQLHTEWDSNQPSGSPVIQLQNDGNLQIQAIHTETEQLSPQPANPATWLDLGTAQTPGSWQLSNDQADYQLQRIACPAWAERIGRDRYGLYAEFSVQDITQRVRWINPGRFLMGSPAEEPERFDDEKQHPVILTQGYWLTDTACTQALWEVVMGDNPAEFTDDPENPVEKISWEEVQTFLEKLNQSVPGLQAGLPTEAQWENACRAGTRTLFSFGDTITPDQANYDGNYPYTGQKKGENRGKTIPVKALQHNAWGLYQMHGNVWEWCRDIWQEDYDTQLIVDPTGPLAGEDRVVRGGSWINGAESLRSVRRDWVQSDDRSNGLGFRFAPGQVIQSAEPR